MNTRTPSLTFAIALLALVYSHHATIFAQGALTPPGTPAPTMKTLDQIEPRTPISALPFTIGARGSYYLTGNLTASADGTAITVAADNVTIDLNGFTLVGGATGTRAGIQAPAVQKGLRVCNGTLTGWTNGAIAGQLTSGSVYENLRFIGNSVTRALRTGSYATVRSCLATGHANTNVTTSTLALGIGSTMSDCTVSSNSNAGISTDNDCTLTNCTASDNGGNGIDASLNCTIQNCTTSFNTGSGITTANSSSVIHCTASANSSVGISVGAHGHVQNCTASGNGGTGIATAVNGSVENCTASANTGHGISAGLNCSVANCTTSANSGNGLVAGSQSTVAHCAASGNTAGYGILVTDDSTITDGTATGNSVGMQAQNGCTITRCTVSKNAYDGLIVNTRCHVTGCSFENNDTTVTTGPGGITLNGGGNRIDSNHFAANNYAGLHAYAAGSVIIRNTFSGAQYIVVPGNVVGPTVDLSVSGGTISSTNPWANIMQP